MSVIRLLISSLHNTISPHEYSMICDGLMHIRETKPFLCDMERYFENVKQRT